MHYELCLSTSCSKPATYGAEWPDGMGTFLCEEHAEKIHDRADSEKIDVFKLEDS